VLVVWNHFSTLIWLRYEYCLLSH